MIDYIFRLLALGYLNRENLVQIKPSQIKDVTGEKVAEQIHPIKTPENKLELQGETTQQFLSSMMGDARVCGTCGHITFAVVHVINA